VEPANKDVVLGGGSLYDVDLEQSRTAVGYWLAPEARGGGVATHAVRLLARWAFSELGLARLELTCGPDNEASQRGRSPLRVCARGVLRSHFSFKGGRDTVVFSVLPHELV
jgi:predicted acetyltransferase